jgi:hypothetical protein
VRGSAPRSQRSRLNRMHALPAQEVQSKDEPFIRGSTFHNRPVEHLPVAENHIGDRFRYGKIASAGLKWRRGKYRHDCKILTVQILRRHRQSAGLWVEGIIKVTPKGAWEAATKWTNSDGLEIA